MSNLIAAIIGTAVFGALCCGWRAWWLFRTYVPAAGVVAESTYTQQMQDDDAPFGRGWYTRGKPGLRFVRDYVQFDDLGGQRRSAWVSRWVSRRYGPDHAYVVWYDPTDARRVTANGPAVWCGCAAIALALLIGCFIATTEIQRQISVQGHVPSENPGS